MYLYLPSENLLISNEGSYSLDNITPFNISNADFHGIKIIKKCKINNREFHPTIA